jgi:catechol 2,3-dioxygenase-like lactoylglutathione lyase family enzyme
MNKSDHRIKGFGEVSIRVKNLNAMQWFYEEVVGLEVLGRDESVVFFNIAEGYAGHIQNPALFDASNRMFLETKSEQHAIAFACDTDQDRRGIVSRSTCHAL